MNFNMTGLLLSTTIMSILTSNISAQDLPAGAEPGRISERFEETATPTVQVRTVRGLESTIPPAQAAAINLKLIGVQIGGSSVYSQEALAELYSEMVGETVTLAQVFEVAAAVTGPVAV
jgi:hemolysin activation/secretion protein